MCIRHDPLFSTCFYARSGDECLVERLGKYHRKLGPGLHFVLKPFETISFKDTLREQLLDIPPQECFTLDNAPLTVDAIVYLRVVNTQHACYNVSQVRRAVLNLCLTHLREEVGRLTLEESFASRNVLSQKIVTTLNTICQDWGVVITRVEIQRLEPSRDILKAMELQMSAERKKRASILQSEGEKSRLVNEAEGKALALLKQAEAEKQSVILESQAEAERQRLEAEGIKMAIETIANAISKASEGGRKPNSSDEVPRAKAIQDALQLLSLIRYMETQSKFSKSDGTKVLMFPTRDR